MQKLVLLSLLFPIFLFSQEGSLLGDVDCNGELTSNDAALILQYVTSTIDSLPCEQNLTGITPEQLQEIVDLIGSEVGPITEQNITMISPMYSADLFPNFTASFIQNNDYFLHYFDAIKFCGQLEYDGYTDWQLPTAKQLQIYTLLNGIVTIENTTENNGYNFWLAIDNFAVGDGGYGQDQLIVYYEGGFRNFYTKPMDGTCHCFCVR